MASPDQPFEQHIGARPIAGFADILGDAAVERMHALAGRVHEAIDGRSIWNVNSTAAGGGVAEMLRSLLAYVRGAGLDARWYVIAGDPHFFTVTKRLHHALHGSQGDGTPLDAAAARHYQATIQRNASEFESLLCPDDVVVLHDPQTLGLAPVASALGARVIWRCHIGADEHDGEVARAWDFLRPYFDGVEIAVFSRSEYAPAGFPAEQVRVIPPSIDPFAAKNQELPSSAVRSILAHTGFLAPTAESRETLPAFVREDGSPSRVERCADIVQLGPPVPPDAPMIVQVSRWDPLKDHIGVMHAFARLTERRSSPDAQLVLAGPNVHGVADDPEAPATFQQVLEAWRALPHGVRKRVRLASLPTRDVEENAAIVNALQRHATVVVQKSLHEGFGLTVAEAMWKSRPVVASGVGGIRDQIEHRVSGLLLPDPTDLDACADALGRLLEDPSWASKLGDAARERVRTHFLADRHLEQYAQLLLEFAS